MHIRQIKNLILCILLGAMLLSLYPAAAVSETEADSLSTQLEALREQYAAVHTETESLRAEQGDCAALKVSLDAENSLTLRALHLLGELKFVYNDWAEEAAAVLSAARSRSERALASYRARMRVMEESGILRYLGLILDAKSLTELLRDAVDIADIIKSDQRLRDEYLAAAEDYRQAKSECDAAMTLLTDCFSELDSLSERLREGLKSSSAVIAGIKKLTKENPKAAAGLNTLSTEIDNHLKSVIQALERQRVSEQGSAELRLSERLFWPVDSSYITSLPGGRVHPITGKEGNHDGADIGIDYGSPVYAADAGRVVISCDGWNGGYGSYIVINHENGIETLYAHLSIRSVSEKEAVVKGQLIGYTGDSGRATGPHLHYELWEKGKRSDPLSLYPEKKFQYSPTA